MPALDTKRLFIAIEIPKNIKNALEAIENSLKETSCDARWANPDNIHLTLKFLGTVEIKNIGPIAQAMISALNPFKTMLVTLNKLDGFPSLNSARILWIGINDQNKKIEKLFLALEDAISPFGFKDEGKKFQAHLTLARIRSAKNKLNLIEKIKEINQKLKPQIFTIDRITLFESRLTPHGPVYSRLQQAHLKP